MPVRTDRGKERTGGHIAEGQTKLAAFSIDAANVIVFVFVQHAAFGDGAGGDDAGDFPLYQSFGQGGVRHLFTDGNLVALLHQPGNVGIHTVIRHAAHGSLLFLGAASVTGC